MEKLDIIHEAVQLLPEQIGEGKIRMNGKEMPLIEYMENILIGHLHENATPQYVAGIIENKFVSKIILGKTKEEKRQYILDFINGLDSFKETIHLGFGQYEDVRERLLTSALDNMDSEFQISFGPRKVSLESYYQIVLKSDQPLLTLADKEEICRSCIDNIEIEVLESQMEGYNGTVQEYITEYLPTIMTSVDQVDFNGRVVYLPEVVEKIVIRQKEIIEENERKKYGNPDFVGELVIQTDGKVVSDAPVKPLEDLSEKELSAMTQVYFNGLTITEDEISSDMSKLMDMIRNVNNKDGFATIKKEVEEFIATLDVENLSEYLRRKLDVMNELLEKKNIIVTKQDILMEEVGDHSYNIANMIKKEAKEQGTADAYSLAIGRTLSMKRDMDQIAYSDYQVQAHVQGIEQELRAATIKSGSIKTNENPEKAVLKSTIEVEYINKFEREVQDAISFGGKAHLEGVVLRLEKEYEKIVIILKDLRKENRLSNEEYQYFKSSISTSLKKLYGSIYMTNEHKSLTAELPVVDDDNLLGLEEEPEQVTIKM